MSIQILQDLKLNGSLQFTDANVDFPLNPEIGTMVLKGTALFAYIKLGGMETWYPFANRTSSYVHTQGLPSTTWTITHNLQTTDVWTQIKDADGHIVTANVSVIDENTVQISFTSAIEGTAVVVAPDSINVPEIKASLINVGQNVEINTNGVLINGSYALTAANIASQIDAAVAVETTARQAADATLTASIASETSARIAADNALQNSITTNFNFEVTARQNADSALQANIDTLTAGLMGSENIINKGAPSGYAPLDSNAKIPSNFLPSYVDDVEEYISLVSFPATGESSKIYVDTATNKTYRWSGSTYTQITSGSVDSVNGHAGVVVLTQSDVGLGNVDNTSDANKPISTATQTALNGKQATLVSATNIKTVNGNSILGSGDLTIVSGGNVAVTNDASTNSSFYPLFTSTTSGNLSASSVSSTKFSFNPSTGQVNAVVFNATSDRNAKDNIQPIENALETVKQIQGVSFTWKDTGTKSYGYIAQEIEQIVPEVVSTDAEGKKSVNYDATIAILLEAVKTLAAKVESLENK